jgi:hypothetical protein
MRFRVTLIFFVLGALSAFAGTDAVKCIQNDLEWHLLRRTPTSTTFPVKRLINPERTEATVAWMVRSKGKSLQDVLKELKIPKSYHKFYAQDGRFTYRPKEPIHLSVENGDEELRAARIQYVNLHEPKERRVYELLISDYLRVLQELPRAKLIVVLNPEDQQGFAQLLKNAPASILARVKKSVIETERVPDLWAQDGSKPIRVKPGAPLQTLVPKELPLSESQQVVWRALEEQGWPTRRTIFDFEGGNVVVGDRHIFVGPDIVEDNMRKFRISRADALAALSAEFGKPVLEIKQNAIPTQSISSMHASIDFHIDMFFAVARNHKTGKETILLSSPELGLKALAGKRKESDFSSDWSIKCEQLVRGAKDDPQDPFNDAEQALVDTLKKAGLEELRRQQDQVNAEAVRLKAMGYDVRFIPGIAQSDPDRIGHVWEIFSYANANFSGKKAMIPELDIPRLDRAARSVFENDLGYQVIPVHSPTESLCVFGGIRCMTETYRY